MKKAGFDKYFKSYSERSTRGRREKDPWVSARSPFEPADIRQSRTFPDISDAARMLQDDLFETEPPPAVEANAFTLFGDKSEDEAFMTNLPRKQSVINSTLKSRTKDKSLKLPDLPIKENHPEKDFEDYGKKEKYYFGTEGKTLFKRHLESFGRNYDKTDKIMKLRDSSWTPRQLYLRECVEEGMTPEMLQIRSSLKQKAEGTLNLSAKGISGKMIQAFANVLVDIPSVKTFDLSSNRIRVSDTESLSRIVKSLALRTELETLNLSDNLVRGKAIATLATSLAQRPPGFQNLSRLYLSHCGLRDSDIPANVAKMLSSAPNLKNLDLSENNLRTGALFSLANIKQSSSKSKPWSSLCQLNIGGNTFRKDDLLALAQSLDSVNGAFRHISCLRCSRTPIGLCREVLSEFGQILSSKSCSLEKLEMRSCMIGRSYLNDFEAFAKGISNNTSISWLDLSHNQIDSQRTMFLGDQLLFNHTLFDFYYRHGNCGRVDNMGFLLPAAIMTTSAYQDDPSGKYENPEADAKARRHFEHSAGIGDANRDYPWRAGKWTETCFTWTPGISGSGTTENVYLRLGADRWWPCPMLWNEELKHYEVWRSLPPGKYKYLFQIGGNGNSFDSVDMNSFEFAEDQKQVALLDPSLSIFGEWSPQQLLVNQREVPPSVESKFRRACPRPEYAWNRRQFDEDEFKTRATQPVPEKSPDKPKPKKHATGIIASVFAPRRAKGNAASQYYDTEDEYSMAANSDLARMCRGEGLKAIISPDEVDRVKDVIRRYYSLICHVHRWYSSFGTGSMVAMNMGMFRMFLGKIEILHDRDTLDSVAHANVLQQRMSEGKEILTADGEIKEKLSYLTENDVVMVFKKAETSVWARKAGDMKNSVGKALDRFEFAEALIRVAQKAFVDTKSQRNFRRRNPRNQTGGSSGETNSDGKDVFTQSEAVEHLLINFVDKHADRSSGNEFRKKYLYISGVDSILRHNMHLLKSVYHHYAAMFSHGSGRKTLTFKEWDALIKNAFQFKVKEKTLGKAIVNLLQKSVKEKSDIQNAESERKQGVEEAEEAAKKSEALRQRKQRDEENMKRLRASSNAEEEDAEGVGFALGLDADMEGGGMFEAEGGSFDELAWDEEGEYPDFGDENAFDIDEDDEATARAIERIQNSFRRRLATIRANKIRDQKAMRLAQLREATKPLEQSKGGDGDAAPAGTFQRKSSLRSDILLVSKQMRKDQDRVMESGGHKDSTLIGGLTDLDVRQAFSFSQMLCIDELVDQSKDKMQYCDFLEGLVRLAQIISQTQASKEGLALEGKDASKGALAQTYYDADGVLHSEKLSPSKYGKYETLGMTQLDIEEKKLAEEMKHLARMEFVIEKVTHLTETIQTQKSR